MGRGRVVIKGRYGKLTVIVSHYDGLYCLCRCDCGVTKKFNRANVKTGKTTSCGCAHKEIMQSQTKHEHARRSDKSNRTYKSWSSMKSRCQDPNRHNYKFYGGLGVKVCDRWQEFSGFLEDMGERPANTTLDRIDPAGNYEPGNCRWADSHTQRVNRRKKTDGAAAL